MAGKKNLMDKLAKLDTAVNEYGSPHADVIRITRSPSVNFAFGNGHGLPRGFTLMAYGPNKGGKTVIGYDTIGALHEDSETACAVRWDTEFRERLQLTPEVARMYGIDMARYKCFSTNAPEEIFDVFEKDVAALCDDGLDLRLAIIDSTSNIQGRREQGAESISQFQIGDHAQTLQIGLKRILPVIRKHGIALILITHLRAELDQSQVRRGNVVKPQASWATKHFAEYFGYVERDDTKDGRSDALGRELLDPTLRDIRGDNAGELTGHKIRFVMKETSAGPRGRQGRFTFDYGKGVVNVHEEVFLLAKARGVISNRGANYYYGERRWNGLEAALEDLRKDPDLQKAIVKELRRRDLGGEWAHEQTQADPSVPDAADAILDSAPVL